jgi:peptide/nickel transport system ATP-binding protein
MVKHFGTRVAVMYLGVVCKLTDTKTLFANPHQPYMQLLLIAIPNGWV